MGDGGVIVEQKLGTVGVFPLLFLLQRVFQYWLSADFR